MLSQLTLEAHNVQRPQVSFRVPAGFMKQSRVSVEQGSGRNCLLHPLDPGRTHKTGSAREGAPASLAQEERKNCWIYAFSQCWLRNQMLLECVWSLKTWQGQMFAKWIHFGKCLHIKIQTKSEKVSAAEALNKHWQDMHEYTQIAVFAAQAAQSSHLHLKTFNCSYAAYTHSLLPAESRQMDIRIGAYSYLNGQFIWQQTLTSGSEAASSLPQPWGITSWQHSAACLSQLSKPHPGCSCWVSPRAAASPDHCLWNTSTAPAPVNAFLCLTPPVLLQTGRINHKQFF